VGVALTTAEVLEHDAGTGIVFRPVVLDVPFGGPAHPLTICSVA